jgi:outer membrane protein
MVVSSRAVVAVGIALAGVGIASLNVAAQQADGSVRKAATPANAAAPRTAAPAAAAPVPAVFGTVDIEAVFKNYDKVKAQQEEFKAAALAKHNELLKIQTEAQEEAAKLQKYTPNGVDAKKAEDHITQLKAQLEAGREQAQRDFALRESEMLATLYKEVQDMVAAVARHQGLTYVFQISNEPVSGSNPNSVMAAMSKTVVYSDPRNDITKAVTGYLNQRYKAAGGVAPKAAATQGATPAAN